MKRSGIKRGVSSLERSPLRSKGFGPRSRANGLAVPQRSSFVASEPQRAKSRVGGCRVHGFTCGNADSMHITDRSIGGCDDPLCVCPGCRAVHEQYDAHTFDLLPYLTLDEQAHAVSHLGILRALKRVTGRDWCEVDRLIGERY